MVFTILRIKMIHRTIQSHTASATQKPANARASNGEYGTHTTRQAHPPHAGAVAICGHLDVVFIAAESAHQCKIGCYFLVLLHMVGCRDPPFPI